MKDNPMDSIKEGVVERLGWARERFSKEWKGVKPFNKPQLSNEELLYIYENMSPEDEAFIKGKYGEDIVNRRFMEMQRIKMRRRRYGGT